MNEIREAIARAIEEARNAPARQQSRDALVSELEAMLTASDALLGHFSSAMRIAVDADPIPDMPSLSAIADAIQAAKRVLRGKHHD
jgi:hypothetical protein